MNNYIVTDKRRQNLIMLVIAISVIMFTIDYSMVNLTLPAIAKDLKVKIIDIAWLPLVYLLIVTSLLLSFGKLADIKGYKKIFITGLCILIAGTLMCGFTPGMKILLAARAFQSLGEAMLGPTGLAILTTCLPSNIRGKALGVVALAQGIGFMAGPLLSGAITTHLGWRFIFFVNVPVGIIAILAAIKILPAEQAEAKDKRFDLAGAVMTFAALATLIFAMNSGARLGWLSPVIIACFAVSAAAIFLFLIREKKIDYPVLDPALFKNRDFTFSTCSAFFAVFVFMGLYFLIPFYLEMVRGMQMSGAGVLLMVAPLAMMLSAPVSGKISDRMGSRFLCSLGMAFAVTGMTAALFLSPSANPVFIAVIMCLLGLAMGTFMPPNNKLIMMNAPDDKQGVASGVYKMTLGIGGVFGIAVFPLVLMQVLVSAAIQRNIPMADIKNMPAVMMIGFRGAFGLGVIVSLLALLFSVLARDRKDTPG